MAAFTGDTVDLSGQREDFSALLHGMPSRIQGSGISRGFDHNDAQTQPADNSVSLWKQPGKWPLVNRHLTQQRALLGDFFSEFLVFRGIDVTNSAGQHSQSPTSGLQGGSMRGCVDSSGQTADDREAGSRQPGGESLCVATPIGRATTRTNDGDCQLVLRQQNALSIKNRGRVADLGQSSGILRVCLRKDIDRQLPALFEGRGLSVIFMAPAEELAATAVGFVSAGAEKELWVSMAAESEEGGG